MRLLFVLVPVLFLVACRPPTTPPTTTEQRTSAAASVKPVQRVVQWDKVPSSSANGALSQSSVAPAAQSAAPTPVAAAAYVTYQEGVIGNGQRSVLFFSASWCPQCSAADGQLHGIYGRGTAKLTTYKINFDEALELRKLYGVTYQHTFVVIDGQGNAERVIQGPTEADLRSLLGA